MLTLRLDPIQEVPPVPGESILTKPAHVLAKQARSDPMDVDTITWASIEIPSIPKAISRTPSDGTTLVSPRTTLGDLSMEGGTLGGGARKSAWRAWLPRFISLARFGLKFSADFLEDGGAGLNLDAVRKNLPNTSAIPFDANVTWASAGVSRVGYYVSLPISASERTTANIINGAANIGAGSFGAISTKLSEKGASQAAINVTSGMGYSSWIMSGGAAFYDELPRFVRHVRARLASDAHANPELPSALTCGRSALRLTTANAQMLSGGFGWAGLSEAAAYCWVIASGGETVHTALSFFERPAIRRPSEPPIVA